MVRGLNWLGALAIGLPLWTAPALADDAAPSMARTLVERQLDAFAHDDGAAAYALASPGIQSLFPDTETFMSMVRKQYAPVYRHRSVEFGISHVEGDAAEQTLTLVDLDNQVWTAVYALNKLPDGSWRITACVLVKSEDKSL